MKAIIHAELILKDHLLPDAVVFVEDSVITGFGPMRTTPVPADCEIIDAQGAYVGPGLIDIHVHAGGGQWFWEDPKTAAEHHLQYGTTTILATMAYRKTVPEYIQHIDLVRSVMPQCPSIGGIYMEGPYINPDFGSLSHLNPWRGGIEAKDYMPLIECLGDLVRVWTVGPEREGIEDFVRAAKTANPAVKFAVGHSQAAPDQIEALIPYGLCIGTHHTNATGDLPKYPECRGVCVDETVNYNDGIYAEIISDSCGIHVDPYMQRLIRKIKGDKIILITDATAYDAINPAGYEHITDLNFTPMKSGGVDISGSRLTLNVACRNFMVHTGASLPEVFRLASYNPARALGMTDRGEIAVGKRADLIFVDDKLNVSKVLLAGQEM